MKNVLVGVFAHPDDEAFGPSASLLAASREGTDVHLILVTDGENGNNPDASSDLGAVRLQEWHQSAELIGTSSQFALHYPDGSLSNSVYHLIAQKVLARVQHILAGYTEQVKLTVMTYERGGITGHLDHIAVSYITTYVYCKLRELQLSDVTFGQLKYYCLPSCIAPNPDTHWLYMGCGMADKDCDEIFDYSSLLEEKLAIMRAHHSQRQDMQAILKLQESTTNPCRYKDHFCYFKD